MAFELTLPARINILGNPSDGVEGDHCTISAAIELRAGAHIQACEQTVIEQLRPVSSHDFRVEQSIEFQTPPPFPYDGVQDLVKAAINRMYDFSPELREKWGACRPRIGTWTHVPRQSGLGGSTLFVLLTLAGLRALYDLDRRTHNDYVLSEMAQRVEARELGITCGFADRYVPLFGGLAYLDYRGKLFHKPIGEEPYVTYEKLDAWVDGLPLVIAHTGVERDSGDVHARMRACYLEEYARHVEGKARNPFMVRIMEEIGSTAWRGKIALLESDLERFGRLMSENHHLVNQMMEHCGFTEGAGWANNLLIDAAMHNGALGAKLTGAGGGGSVFALVRSGDEPRVADCILQAARQNGLDSATVFVMQHTGVGLTVQPLAAG
jgi:D-glycero-alpha-D-manno-heptose-7-phosphate kinase